MKRETGFTLIELIVVIVIIGILAATALPKFVDLSKEAGDAAASGTAGALSSATSLNYAKWLTAGNSSTSGATQIKNGFVCSGPTGLQLLMSNSVLPANITATGTTAAGCAAAGFIDTACRVRHSQGNSPGPVVSVVCTG